MAWITPKTDWHVAYDENGVYVGDFFNAADFNRLKNNLEHLRDMAVKLYKDFDIVSLGADRTYRDYFYADEINQLAQNLKKANECSFDFYHKGTPNYVANGNTMGFKELNEMESQMQELYKWLTEQAKGRRMLTFNLGIKGGL